MKNSKDEKVQAFLDEIMHLNEEQFQILQRLRSIVFEQHPATSERIMYGGILFSLAEDFGGIFAYKNHVSFEFSLGYQMKDPKQVLEGGGKFRRHLKIRTLQDIDDKQVDFFVKQVV